MMSVEPEIYFHQILNDEYNLRKTRNHRYSWRAFARSLGISPSMLSRLVARKSGVSVKTAVSIVSRLELDKAQAYEFIVSLSKIS